MATALLMATQAVQRWPEELLKYLKALAWPQKFPDLNLINNKNHLRL